MSHRLIQVPGLSDLKEIVKQPSSVSQLSLFSTSLCTGIIANGHHWPRHSLPYQQDLLNRLDARSKEIIQNPKDSDKIGRVEDIFNREYFLHDVISTRVTQDPKLSSSLLSLKKTLRVYADDRVWLRKKEGVRVFSQDTDNGCRVLQTLLTYLQEDSVLSIAQCTLLSRKDLLDLVTVVNLASQEGKSKIFAFQSNIHKAIQPNVEQYVEKALLGCFQSRHVSQMIDDILRCSDVDTLFDNVNVSVNVKTKRKAEMEDKKEATQTKKPKQIKRTNQGKAKLPEKTLAISSLFPRVRVWNTTVVIRGDDQTLLKLEDAHQREFFAVLNERLDIMVAHAHADEVVDLSRPEDKQRAEQASAALHRILAWLHQDEDASITGHQLHTAAFLLNAFTGCEDILEKCMPLSLLKHFHSRLELERKARQKESACPIPGLFSDTYHIRHFHASFLALKQVAEDAYEEHFATKLI